MSYNLLRFYVDWLVLSFCRLFLLIWLIFTIDYCLCVYMCVSVNIDNFAKNQSVSKKMKCVMLGLAKIGCSNACLSNIFRLQHRD